MPVTSDPAEIARVFREEYARAVSILVRRFGDIDLAEEAVQGAFTVALQRWPADGPPPSPAGWILTTARNQAIDHLRREAIHARLQAETIARPPDHDPLPTELDREDAAVPDDRLSLLFT